MSGTSLDGLDIALCDVTGSGRETEVKLRKFSTVDYSAEQKKRLKRITSVETVALRDLCYMHTHLAADHAGMINRALKNWGLSSADVDCIASHGQTIYHLPGRDQPRDGQVINSTLQIADGDHIAARTGILTISDFRQKHTAYGGEGAPMAALIDRILFGCNTETRILLNIGGIANYTVLPAGKCVNRASYTTDTGPGNTLIDNIVQHYFDRPFDKDGAIAGRGSVHDDLLQNLRDDPWFSESGSKSTGPEYFNLQWLMDKIKNTGSDPVSITPEDIVATATELSACTIADSIKINASDFTDATIYVSGGGARNPELTNRIQNLLPAYDVRNFSDLGMDPDAKEAVIFAVLANEMLAGDGFEFDAVSGSRKVNFGKISFP